MYWSQLWWQGDFPQNWPPGPIVPANEGYLGAGVPTPIGNQQSTSTPAASTPPVNPSNLPGVPNAHGQRVPGIPPTYFWPSY